MRKRIKKGGFCVSRRYLITATIFCIAGHDLSLHLSFGFIQSKPVSRLLSFLLPAARVGSCGSVKVQILQDEGSVHWCYGNFVASPYLAEVLAHSHVVNSICRA